MNTNQLHGLAGTVWAVLGISLLLISAIFRLGQIALNTFNGPLSWYHWVLLAFTLFFMAYMEGYKGFQLKFSPRVAARCFHLFKNPRLRHTLLAPFFCMGFFYTTRKRQITTVLLTLTIISLVQLAHLLTQPWRGILDAGVVVGLVWGLLSFYFYLLQVFTGKTCGSPELPNQP
ncbi:MAG: hypothetical protein K9K86_08170 [Pseudomonadales bacterium]|nr:hypothetical protein [Pseudomonadales bacterium]